MSADATDLASLKDALYKAETDIVAIHPIAGIATDEIPDWIENFAHCYNKPSQILSSIPELRPLFESDTTPDSRSIHAVLQESDRTGYILEIKWNRRKYLDFDTWVSGSGIRHRIWIYAESIVDGFNIALQHANAHHIAQRKITPRGTPTGND